MPGRLRSARRSPAERRVVARPPKKREARGRADRPAITSYPMPAAEAVRAAERVLFGHRFVDRYLSALLARASAPPPPLKREPARHLSPLIQPWFGMWSANIVIGLMGLYLTMRIGRESLVINWDFLWRIVPRRWRASWTGEEKEPATL